MSRKFLADAPIDTAFVSAEMRFLRSDGNDQRPDGLRRDICDMKLRRFASALYEREDGLLWGGSPIGAILGPPANIGFVRFDTSLSY